MSPLASWNDVPMNVHLPAPHRRWPARLVNLAVVVVVLALAAATFVLSYSGVHAIALQSGVSARLARVYPATFDAVLVIACAAALMLRDARWWAKYYAWFAIVVVVAVAGAADAVHAMNVALQHRTMEGVVAATPWVLALLGFSLMLTIFQHSRAQHAAATAAPGAARSARRARKRAADQPSLPPGAPIEPQAELARNPVSPPALPAAATPVTQPSGTAHSWAGPAPLGGLPVTDEPLPTVVVPSLAEPDASAAAGHGDAADSDVLAQEPGPAETVPAAEAAAPRYVDAPEEPAPDYGYAAADAPLTWPFAAPIRGAAPTGHFDAEEDMEPEAGPEESGLVAVPEDTTGTEETGEARHDYWDADETGQYRNRRPFAADAGQEPPFGAAPFATVPRLNRVRATPVPPEEDEE